MKVVIFTNTYYIGLSQSSSFCSRLINKDKQKIKKTHFDTVTKTLWVAFQISILIYWRTYWNVTQTQSNTPGLHAFNNDILTAHCSRIRLVRFRTPRWLPEGVY